MNIIDYAISHSRVVLGILIFILVAGTFSYIKIPKEAAPDVNIPFIYISLSQKGISPDDSERLLVKPIEDEVKTVEGVKEVRSTSYSGGGNVLLEFNPGFDADKAIVDVREKVDKAKGDLPNEADEPTVNEVNVSAFPILLISLSGDLPDRALQDLAEYLQEEIETIPSVLEAKIGGKRKEQVDIIIDVRAVEGYGINLNTLINIVKQNNMMVSAGEQDTGDGSFAIKVPGLFENLNDVLDTPIKSFGDSVITFRDIAKVKRTFEDRKSYARVNGKNSVTIEVSKRVGENIIDTVDQVKKIVKCLNKNSYSIISIFSGRMADVGKDPVPIIQKSVKITKNMKKIKILWASTRDPYNYIQANDCKCEIITLPPKIIESVSKFGKSFIALTLDTVKTFYKDASEANFKI